MFYFRNLFPALGSALGESRRLRRFVKFFFTLFFFVTLFFTVHSSVHAATYYVDQVNGLNGNSGDQAHPWQTISKLNGFAFSAGDTVYLNRGNTWAEFINLATSNAITIDAYGIGNPPKITGNGTYSLYANTNGLILRNLHFDGSAIRNTNSKNGIKLQNCLITNSPGYGITVYSAIGDAATPGFEIDNCLITGNLAGGVLASGTNSYVKIRNSIVVSNLVWGMYSDTSSTIDYDYSLISGNSINTGSNFNSGTFVDGGHNLISYYPYFSVPKVYPGYFSLAIDDQDVTYAQQLIAGIPSGHKLTFFVAPNQTNLLTSRISDLQTIAQAGHEIGIHSWTHTPLNSTTAFTINSTNANPSINIDVNGTQLVLSTTTPGNSQTFNLNTQTIGGIKAWQGCGINVNPCTGKGWTVTTTTNVSDSLSLYALADSGGVNTVFPYTANMDLGAGNGLYRAEILQAKTWLDTNILSPLSLPLTSTLAYPYGLSTAGVVTYLKDTLGLLGARDAGSFTTSNIGLNSLQIYHVMSADAHSWAGDESAMRKQARHIATLIHTFGGIYTSFQHTTADLTVQQTAWLLDELSKYGIYSQTFSSAITAIRADHSSADGLTYTKTYATNSSDYQLQYKSPSINAGTSVSGINTDILGNSLVGTPDIGPYEFQAPAAPTSLAQYKSDGTTTISAGGFTPQTSVVLKFTMSSVNASDSITPQVEVQEVGTAFTNTITNSGSAVAYSGTPVTGTVTITGLASGKSYHWQAEVSNSAGQSAWVAMGGSPDFQVDTTAPTVTINQTGGQADPTNVSPINFTVVFSDSVSDFTTGDVTLSGTAGATTATVTGSGTTYNVAVTGATDSGTVVATVAAGIAHDTIRWTGLSRHGTGPD